jgi:hypothetical protein
MSNLDPVAFDIETSGFDDDAVVTVAGFAYDLGESLICNLDGRDQVALRRTVGLRISHGVCSRSYECDHLVTSAKCLLGDVLSRPTGRAEDCNLHIGLTFSSVLKNHHATFVFPSIAVLNDSPRSPSAIVTQPIHALYSARRLYQLLRLSTETDFSRSCRLATRRERGACRVSNSIHPSTAPSSSERR